MTTIATSVSTERIESLTLVQTTACDAWRAVVTLRGELDGSVVTDVFAELTGHLEAGRAVVRVDVNEVTFIDSTVLGVFVLVHERCRAAHSTMILTGVRPALLRLLAITGLDSVLLVDGAPGEQ